MAPLNPDTATEDEIAQALWRLVDTEGSRTLSDWSKASEEVKAVVRRDAKRIRAIWDGWTAPPTGDPLIAAVMQMASSMFSTDTTL